MHHKNKFSVLVYFPLFPVQVDSSYGVLTSIMLIMSLSKYMIIALEVLAAPSVAIPCLQENVRQLWHIPAWNKYDNQQFSCISW